MKFCDKLPKLRKSHNLSQEQLADRLGVSRQAISKWESGSSYPDMEKILQICNELDCTLEELMDDGVIGNSNKRNKYNFNDFLDNILKSITKVYNMIASMTWKQRFKCLFEMLLIIFSCFLLGIIIYSILTTITNNIFYNIPLVGDFILNILDNVYLIILLILGIIITIHLFRIRYLDYYIIIEDKNIENKIIEEPIQENKNKIIIRDPKHSTLGIIKILERIFMFFIKCFILCLAIPLILVFILAIILAAISSYHIIYGIIFLFITISLLGAVLLIYVIIEFIYKFIFNQSQSLRKFFVLIIIGFILLGVGIGLSCVSILNFNYKVDLSDLTYKTVIKNIKINDNTIITGDFNNNIEYIINNDLSEGKIEISYIDKFEYEFIISENDHYYIGIKSINNIYKVILNDIKNNEIRSYNLSDLIKIKVYLNQEDYDKLEGNNYVF